MGRKMPDRNAIAIQSTKNREDKATKLAKKLSGYTLIRYDMQFSGRVFGLAAKQEQRTAKDMSESLPSVEMRVHQLFQLDPILRAGASVAQIDPDYRNETEDNVQGRFR